jgi:hypothetical protein
VNLELAFAALLAVLVVSALGVRRARTRAQLRVAGLAPLIAFLAYEALVQRAMPRAEIRLDWLLLFPILVAHGAHAVARGRRLRAERVD